MEKRKKLIFKEETHEYILEGKVIPSVTQITQPISKILYENIEMPTLRNKAKIGTKVHRIIELYNNYGLMTDSNADERTKNYFKSYLEWHNQLEKQEVKYNEFQDYYEINEEDEKTHVVFAGTIDNIRVIDDVLYLIDYKTVANPNDTILSLQLYGYKLIAEQSLGVKVNKFAGLCLKKDSYNFIDLTDLVNDEKTKELFDLLYRLNKSLEEHKIRSKAKQYNEESF